jgi:probable F420-dependent oxidoreductase
MLKDGRRKGTNMQLGIHLPHIGRKAGPDAIRRAAVRAEQLGFDDVWVSEHIIIPKDAAYPPSANFWDPVLTLTWAAAATDRVRLGTSVLVLPLRHPLPLAKELATLQNLSNGRLILGAGVGWLEAEFDALGVPFKERGRRMDEGIAMMRAVWSQDPITFETKWIAARIDRMRSQPQPFAPIPIWIGGSSEAAIRRAARLDGWHGSQITPQEAAAMVKPLRSERPDPAFAISVRVTCSADTVAGMRDTLRAYSDAGIQHVMGAPQDRDIDGYFGTVEAFREAGEGV